MPHRPRVLICCPVYQPCDAKKYAKHKGDPTPLPHGLLHPATRKSIAATIHRYRNEIRIGIATVTGVACIEQARGHLYGQYREQGRADYLWMIDSDVSWEPDTLGRLMDRDLPLVGAAYCLKQDDAEENLRSAARFRPDRLIDATGLVEAEYLNGGFMLLRDDLLRRMEQTFPDLAYKVNPPSEMVKTFGFWHPCLVPYPPWIGEMHPELAGEMESLSEDWAFCHRARKAGFIPWNDCSVQVGHWAGNRVYQLPALEAA
jgi:hypothetical protein